MFATYEQIALTLMGAAVIAVVLTGGALAWIIWQEDRRYRRHRNSHNVLPAAGQVWRAPCGDRIRIRGTNGGSVQLAQTAKGRTVEWEESLGRWRTRVQREGLWLHRAA